MSAISSLTDTVGFMSPHSAAAAGFEAAGAAEFEVEHATLRTRREQSCARMRKAPVEQIMSRTQSTSSLAPHQSVEPFTRFEPSSARIEPISHPGLGHEIAWIRRIRLQLLSQLPHEYPQILRLFLRRLAPDGFKKRGMREDTIRVARHVNEEIKLLRRQPHFT